jgi:hypothetical protein
MKHVLALATTVVAALAGCDFTQNLGNTRGSSFGGGSAASSSSGVGGVSASSSAAVGGAPMCVAEYATITCDDLNPCTNDTCIAGACANLPVAKGFACGPGVSCDGHGNCAPSPAIWARMFGGVDDQGPQSIALDAEGNIFLAGNYDGDITFDQTLPPAGTGVTSAFLAKLDPMGNPLWSRALVGETAAGGLVVDSMGDVILAGSLAGSTDFGGGTVTNLSTTGIYVAKYTSDGDYVWSDTYGEAGGYGNTWQIAVDGMDDIILTSAFGGSAIDFGCGSLPAEGSYDAVVAKLDSSGACQWSKRFGDDLFQQTSAAVVDPWGYVTIIGDLAGTADFGDNLLHAAGQDLFVAQFDPEGSSVWSERFGGSTQSVQWNGALAVGADGTLAIAGWFRGTLVFGGETLTTLDGMVDGYVLTLDRWGNPLWSKGFGANETTTDQSVAIDASGDVIITGTFPDTVDFGGGQMTSAGQGDIFLAKFDRQGDLLWSRQFGDAADQSGWAVSVDGAGNIYLAAEVVGSVDMGTGLLTSSNGADVLVAKLLP